MEKYLPIYFYLMSFLHFDSILSWFPRLYAAETKALILWSPDVKSQLIGRDPDAGKDWEQEKKGMTEDEMAG